VVGWVAAALPALGFLALVKMILGRSPIPLEPPAAEVEQAGAPQADDGRLPLSVDAFTRINGVSTRTGGNR